MHKITCHLFIVCIASFSSLTLATNEYETLDYFNPIKRITGISSADISANGQLKIKFQQIDLLPVIIEKIDSNGKVIFVSNTKKNQLVVTSISVKRQFELLIYGLSRTPIPATIDGTGHSGQATYNISKLLEKAESNGNQIRIECLNCETPSDQTNFEINGEITTIQSQLNIEKSIKTIKQEYAAEKNRQQEAAKLEKIEQQKAIEQAKKMIAQQKALELHKQQYGDESPDDLLCKKFGFKPQTQSYGDCRLKLEIVRRQAQHEQAKYDEQKRQYDDQVAAIQKERERQRGLKQLELGLRMMGGQPIQDAVRETAGMPPIPKPPGQVNQTIIMPGGRMVNCTTIGTVTNCF